MSEGLFGDLDPRVDQALAALQRIEGWPYDEAKDAALVRSLLAEYPDVDLAVQIGRFDENRRAKQVEVKSWRLRLHTWLREGRRHGIENRSNRIGSARSGTGRRPDGAVAGGSRSSSRAGAVGEFGGRSGRLDW